MENIIDIPIVEELPISLRVGEGDTSGGLKVVELFGMANGGNITGGIHHLCFNFSEMITFCIFHLPADKHGR